MLKVINEGDLNQTLYIKESSIHFPELIENALLSPVKDVEAMVNNNIT